MRATNTYHDDDSIWVIYEGPQQFPDQYVARRMHLCRPTTDVIVGDTINDVRNQLPAGLYRMPRCERDEPQVRESWI